MPTHILCWLIQLMIFLHVVQTNPYEGSACGLDALPFSIFPNFDL